MRRWSYQTSNAIYIRVTTETGKRKWVNIGEMDTGISFVHHRKDEPEFHLKFTMKELQKLIRTGRLPDE